MEDNSKKTRRGNEEIIPSGITPEAKTQKDEAAVIKSGVTISPTPSAQIISAGIVTTPSGEITLNNQTYRIIKVISRLTGEAEVYLIEREKQKYILKYYYHAFKPKDTILQKLKGIPHEDIIDLIDYGYYQDRFFEILEYAEGGSLLETNTDGTYKYIPIKDVTKIKQIVKEVVNALKFCHDKGIIHRDLKPGNIFFTNPDGTDIQIGDFGISSILDEGLSKHLTGQARTEIYAAPELYQTIGGKTVISKEVDYYALGITLIHIWSGEEPFKGLSPYAIMKAKCDGKVYIPKDMPEELETLIKGLITVEPSKRWGYEEVQKWLRGEYVPVYYKTVEFNYEPFPFGLIEGEQVFANNPRELADLLLKYPETGKKHLYKKRIQQWLEKANDPVFTEIEKIVEDEYPNDEDAGLIKAVYVLDPLRSYKTSAGRECRTTEELGDAIENEALYYRNYLTQKKNADLFLYLEAHGAKDVADAFRKYAQAYTPERAFNMMILDLQADAQGVKRFKIGNHIYYRPKDLLTADDKIKEKLVKELVNPDSKLSIFLEGFTKLKNNINKWRQLGRHNTVTLTYALDEKSPFIAFNEKAYSLNDFMALFAKNILNKDFIAEMTNPNSIFVTEADFWLKNYCGSSYFAVMVEFLEKNILNINKDICTRLCEYIIEAKPSIEYYWNKIKPLIDIAKNNQNISTNTFQKHKDFIIGEYSNKIKSANYEDRKRIVEKLRTIEPSHRLIERFDKEEKLFPVLKERKLKEIEEEKKIAIKKVYQDFDQIVRMRKKKIRSSYKIDDKFGLGGFIWGVTLILMIGLLFGLFNLPEPNPLLVFLLVLVLPIVLAIFMPFVIEAIGAHRAANKLDFSDEISKRDEDIDNINKTTQNRIDHLDDEVREELFKMTDEEIEKLIKEQGDKK